MITIYVYVLDTLADWELGHVISELNTGRFFKSEAKKLSLKTVSNSKDTIRTMGGFTIVPDCLIDDMVVNESSVLLLPGANTWNSPKHNLIIAKAKEFLDAGAMVGAICGATSALANAGILDNRAHTSNATGFLELVAPSYKGQDFYVDEPSVINDNLITAGSTGGLLFAKQVLEYLDVFRSDSLEAWYNYFSTGKPEHFYALMQTLPSNDDHN